MMYLLQIFKITIATYLVLVLFEYDLFCCCPMRRSYCATTTSSPSLEFWRRPWARDGVTSHENEAILISEGLITDSVEISCILKEIFSLFFTNLCTMTLKAVCVLVGQKVKGTLSFEQEVSLGVMFWDIECSNCKQRFVDCTVLSIKYCTFFVFNVHLRLRRSTYFWALKIYTT